MEEKQGKEEVVVPETDETSQVAAQEAGGEEVKKSAEKEAESPRLNEISDETVKGEMLDINFLLDIPLDVTVELGKTKMIINDLLQLGQGSVLELPKLVGEPMEVLVNNKLVARGEPVVVNEKFGIRLTDIVSPLERLEGLK